MQFQVGDKVKYNKPLLIAHGDSREGLIGRIVPRRNHSLRISEFVPVVFPESSNTWYLNPLDLEKIKEPQQPILECFYKADRERAHVGMNAFQLAYVEKLEAALRASDAFWTAMQMCVMSPQQYQLSEAVLEANAQVNFCSEQDCVELPACHAEEEFRSLIFK